MKYIAIPKTDENTIIEQFKNYISNHKTNTGKINFTYDYAKPDCKVKKPTVIFTTEAYLKVTALVDNCSTEIGWHGLVERKKNIFHITDILVYPQTVTGATVDSDDKEYPKWLMNISDDDFNKLRMQGHSHVNFSTMPSGTDTNFYDKLLQSMDKNDYYIFMIINKKKELNIWIYDFKTNLIFEKEDITVDVVLQDKFLNKWYDTEYKANIKQKTYANQYYGKWNTGGASKNVETLDANEYEYDYDLGMYRRYKR